MTWFANIPAIPRRLQAALAGVLLLLLILIVFPFKLSTAPTWRLRVVDDSGGAVRNIKVTEHWQHYLVESEGHEEVLTTDGDGVVDFPERTVRASLLSRLLAKFRRFGSREVPLRPGPYASIVVWGRRDYETVVAVYVPDAPLPGEVVVHRQR